MNPPAPPLPPRIPATLAELTWVIEHLGHVAKGQRITGPRQARMTALIGSNPGPKPAKVWKEALLGLAREMRALGETVVDFQAEADLRTPAQKRSQQPPKAPEPDKRATYRDPPEQAPTAPRKRVLDVSGYTPLAVEIFKRKGAAK